MSEVSSQPRKATLRDLIYFRTPSLWKTWPYLPVIRRRPDAEMDCGVLYDFQGTSGLCGYSATVFITNLFTMPRTMETFLALPKEVFDTPEEIGEAGWVVD